MSELKKHENFKALKSDRKVEKASVTGERVLAEFEAFMNLLQHQFSIKKQDKATNGNQSR